MKQFVLQPDEPSQPQPDLLKGLNPEQQKAVQHTDGPLLIIAGAGSGKTRVLTYRIANLLAQNKAEPHQVLALTFTNKAAREMRERIEDLIDERARKLWMGTFHSIFSRILRVECERLGYTRDFSIYDTQDSERMIKTIMQELNIDTKEIKPRNIRFIISEAKNELVDPQQFENQFIQSSMHDVAAQVYRYYITRLKESNAMDFDDLLIKPIELFEQYPEVLETYQKRFKYILIDEYQDTNHAQYKVTKMLAAAHHNICVVGDDAQSIYSFRGADISNILNFQQDYPEAIRIPLEKNYRSTKSILKCADSVIKNNDKQLDKTLWTDNEEGNTVTVLENFNDRDEANRIASYINQLKLEYGYKYSDMAILYRTNAQSRVFEDALRRKGIAYQIVGGISFYQRKEIKDVVAYLKLLINPSDEESLMRVINEPARGIGDKSLSQIREYARKNSLSVWETMQQIDQTGIYKPAQKRVVQFVEMIQGFTQRLGSEALIDTVKTLLETTGYVKQFVDENTHEALTRRENVMELLNVITQFEEATKNADLSRFLQDISLITDLDAHEENPQSVTLMTVHAAKGLEFPIVFVTGLEEELFPMGGRNGEEADIEEERRLFYVATTRAEERLFFSYAKSRYKFGEEKISTRSRFLDEVDPGVVRTETGATIRQKSGKDSDFGGSGFGGTSIDYDWKQPATGTTRGTTTEIHYDNEDLSQLRTGAKVIHPKFGPGKVINLENRGEDSNVVIFFQNKGQKKLKLKHAKLKIIE